MTQSHQSAPGPKPTPLIGNMRDMSKLGIIGFGQKVWKEYGDVSRFQFGPMRAHMFVRPEHVKHILVEHRENYIKGASHDKLRMWLGRAILTSEGADWQKQRRLMAPTYTPKNITRFAEIMTAVACETRDRLMSQRRQPVNINAEMVRLTTSVISRSMFSEDIVDTTSKVDVALQVILGQSVQRMTLPVDLPLFIPTPSNRAYRWAVNTLDGFIYEIIERRRAQSEGTDLLWLLIQARDQETGAVMDNRQLRDEVLVTFFAGHETTAQLLTWAWKLLSENPQVESKLHEELSRVLNGRTPTVEDVPNLTYTRMIVDETLRLYPPVAMFPRDVVNDDEIEGYLIPKGTMVFVGPYMTHRHPEFWDRPLEFHPEHFAPGQAEKRPQYAYYPFSAGPRTCIGNHFALLEATLVLAELAQRLTLRLLPGQNLEPEFVGTLRPSKATLMMSAEER
jgi:cytochrome P450